MNKKFNELGRMIKPPSFVGTDEEVRNKSLAILKAAINNPNGNCTYVPPKSRTATVPATIKAKKEGKKQPPQANKLKSKLKPKLNQIDITEFEGLDIPIETSPLPTGFNKKFPVGPNNIPQLYELSSQAEPRSFNVTLVSSFGRIKVPVLKVLDEAGAVILVFRDEDDVTFVPNHGDTLTLITNNGEQQVF